MSDHYATCSLRCQRIHHPPAISSPPSPRDQSRPTHHLIINPLDFEPASCTYSSSSTSESNASSPSLSSIYAFTSFSSIENSFLLCCPTYPPGGPASFTSSSSSSSPCWRWTPGVFLSIHILYIYLCLYLCLCLCLYLHLYLYLYVD